MGVPLKIFNQSVEGVKAELDLTAAVIVVLGLNASGVADEELFEVSYPFSSAPAYPIGDYYVALLGHAYWLQSDVFSLRIDGNSQPVGALFSIEVLSSGFHWGGGDSPKRRTVMEQYASIALHKLCVGDVRGGVRPDIKVNSYATFSILDLYHPDTVVTIFKSSDIFPPDVLAKNDPRELNDYFLNYAPGFYEKGLAVMPWDSTGVASSVPNKYRDIKAWYSPASIEKNLTIQQFSTDLTESQKEYFLTIFQYIDPFETNSFFRFFIYYQAFEQWMQGVHQKNIVSFRSAIINAENEDASLFRDKLQKLGAVTKEKARLGKVFASNQPHAEEQAILLNACNHIFKLCCQTERSNPVDALYQVRNLMVHSFNRVKVARREFDNLADVMLGLICRMAIGYRNPPPDDFSKV